MTPATAKNTPARGPTTVVAMDQASTPTSRRADDFSHLVAAALLAAVAVALVALASVVVGRPAEVFTREPQTVLHGDWYVGGFSNLGGIVWFATAAVATFAAWWQTEARGALSMAAGISWAMGIDDIFLLHDVVYPRFHIPEKVVFAAYFVAIGLLVVRHRRVLTRSTILGVGLTVFCWVASAGFDQYMNYLNQLVEDGFKFAGLSIWCATWLRQSRMSISSMSA